MHSAGMPTTLEQANELIYKLLDRIAELEDRLNQHSGNSSAAFQRRPRCTAAGPQASGVRQQRGAPVTRDIAASGIRLMPA